MAPTRATVLRPRNYRHRRRRHGRQRPTPSPNSLRLQTQELRLQIRDMTSRRVALSSLVRATHNQAQNHKLHNLIVNSLIES